MKITFRLFLAIIALTVLTIAAFFHGLHGDFEFDDVQNILDNNRLVIQKLDWRSLQQAALSGNAGILKRPLSMLSFALNEYACGFNPYCFKLVNLCIHIVTGLSLYFLTYLLLMALRKFGRLELPISWIGSLSFLVAAAWMLHPLAVTSVLYVVQRMNSLSALFTIWAVIAYVWGRQRLCDGKAGVIFAFIGVMVFGVMAIFSKENGALLPLFMLAVEIIFFRFQAPSIKARLGIYIFFIATVLIPAIGFIVFISVNPDWLMGSYHTREFTLSERLLTEARVIWLYLHMMLLPKLSLMGLYHDDILISQDLFTPISTACSVLGIIVLFAITIWSCWRAPILGFGLLWFFCGHAMESTILPLEIAHEHRNYLPLYGILFTFFYYLTNPAYFLKSLKIRNAAAVMMIALYMASTFLRTEEWGNLVDHAAIEVTNHPNSERANYQMARMYFMLYIKDPKEQYYERAIYYFTHAKNVAVIGNGGLFGLIQIGYYAHKEINPEWVVELEERLSTRPLQASDIAFLKNLMSCNIYTYCRLGNEEMLDILNSAIQNSKITSGQKANILTMLGEYYFNKLGQYSETERFFLESVKLAPQNIQFYANLIHFYSVVEQFEAAQKELAIARGLDRLDEFKGILDAEEQFLRNRLALKKN